MEGDRKRLKRDTLPDDAAAQEWLERLRPILERWDEFGYQERYGVFPRDVWSVILSNLTAGDIVRLARLSHTFRELAEASFVWDAIFVREFGRAALDEARQTMPNARARLFAWRLRTFLPTPAAFENVPWIFKNAAGDKVIISFMGPGLYLMYETDEEREERVALLLDHGFAEYDLNLYREGQQPNYFRVFGNRITVIAQDRADVLNLAVAFIYSKLTQNYYPVIIEHYKEMLRNEICAYCALPADELRCSVCKSAFYCNAACQENDWTRHKKKCLK